jgi:hypothetical protein
MQSTPTEDIRNAAHSDRHERHPANHEAKTLLDDQIARDAFAHPVELGRTMGRLAEQDDARRPDTFHQWAEIGRLDGWKRFSGVSEIAD